MTALRCRCTKGLNHVNSLRTINIHLLNHEFSDLKVQSVALRSLEFHELKCTPKIIQKIRAICGRKNLKYSRSMLIVGKLLTCLKRPVYRCLKGVGLEG